MAWMRRGAARDGSLPAEDETPGAADPSENAALPPSRMRGTEPLYGYVVGAELLVMSILNIVVDRGPGAPKHPQVVLQALGVAAAVGFFALLQMRNRNVAGFSAIVAAFFATLPKVPNSLSVAHVFTLAVPLAYGLVITQRQRRAMGLSRRGGRGARRPTPEDRRREVADRRAARRRAKEPAPSSGPRANARYTPPKARRSGKPR
ncbi:MAG TPA: hypothetical protein VKI19_03885 [Acidimicrobiales bacterium]|nr:hypothetical protein [Acidimicrobiales bacterium]